jgi:hypothetical protein
MFLRDMKIREGDGKMNFKWAELMNYQTLIKNQNQ